MGQITDAKIAARQEASGIEPARGGHFILLKQIQQSAFELIKVIELEKSGIRDGDGGWYGADPISGLIDQIVIAHANYASPTPVGTERNSSKH